MTILSLALGYGFLLVCFALIFLLREILFALREILGLLQRGELPPLHYNCRSSLVPIFSQSEAQEEQSPIPQEESCQEEEELVLCPKKGACTSWSICRHAIPHRFCEDCLGEGNGIIVACPTCRPPAGSQG